MDAIVTASAKRPAAEDQPESAVQASVLVVDDHPSNLLAVEAILEPLGHRLVMATSGEEALRHLLNEDFALILLDVQMAKLDGFATAALIKGPERTRHIPIMFLTAVDRDVEQIFAGYRQGAVDYLLKPIEPQLLRAKVTVFVDLYLQAEKIKRQAAMLAERAALYEHERRARTAAEAATRAREDALAVVSHDLRTPLSTISTAAEAMLAAMPDDAKYAGLRKTSGTILRVAEQMAGLISDLLEVSQMEAGHLTLDRRPHPTDALISQALELLQPLVAQRDRHITITNAVADLPVLCDPSRLSQVFSNLVGNAVKFTRPDGVIALRTRRVGDLVEFSVTDDGSGIAADQLPHVFERYWKARTADREGVGLGLAIAKGIVEAHDGTIRVESSTAGTTFTFTIPVAGSVVLARPRDSRG